MRIELLEEIRRRIHELPRRPDELGVAGVAEEQIAQLYERLGDRVASGDWWVRSAAEAEKYGQVIIAHQRLLIGMRYLPEHLGIRRELDRIGRVLVEAGLS